MCDKDTDIIAIDSILFRCKDLADKLSEVTRLTLLRFQVGQILEETYLLACWKIL